jgi:hypothetical protein
MVAVRSLGEIIEEISSKTNRAGVVILEGYKGEVKESVIEH